jgi:chromosomal replication initiation ATPase DnaA
VKSRPRRDPLAATLPPAELSNAKLQAFCTCVADAFGYSLSDVLYGSRQAGIVRARLGCYYALRQRGLSLTEIGELLGVHHTTVLTGVRKVERELKRFPDGWSATALRKVVEELRFDRAARVRQAIAELQAELGALELDMNEVGKAAE